MKTDTDRAGLAPSERVDDIPRILDEMRGAVRDALLRHKRAGNPIATWRDGRVVWIEPQDIPVESPSPVARDDRA